MAIEKIYLEEGDVIVGNIVFLKLDANNQFHFDGCEDDMYYDGHLVYFDNEEGKYYYEEPDEEEKLLYEKHINSLEMPDINPSIFELYSDTDAPVSKILDDNARKEHIIFNIVDESSKLAHNAMIDELLKKELILSEKEVYQDDGTYFDFAQEVFNRHYDYFYNELYSTTFNSKEELEEKE